MRRRTDETEVGQVTLLPDYVYGGPMIRRTLDLRGSGTQGCQPVGLTSGRTVKGLSHLSRSSPLLVVNLLVRPTEGIQIGLEEVGRYPTTRFRRSRQPPTSRNNRSREETEQRGKTVTRTRPMETKCPKSGKRRERERKISTKESDWRISHHSYRSRKSGSETR